MFFHLFQFLLLFLLADGGLSAPNPQDTYGAPAAPSYGAPAADSYGAPQAPVEDAYGAPKVGVFRQHNFIYK